MTLFKSSVFWIALAAILSTSSVARAQGPPPYRLPTTVVPQTWFGVGAPGAVPGNLPGDFYYDNSASPAVQYVCTAPYRTGTVVTPPPACSNVAAGQWQEVGSGSSGSCVSAPCILDNGTTATTQSPGDNTGKVATDAFVLANGGGTAPALGTISVNSGTGAATWPNMTTGCSGAPCSAVSMSTTVSIASSNAIAGMVTGQSYAVTLIFTGGTSASPLSMTYPSNIPNAPSFYVTGSCKISFGGT